MKRIPTIQSNTLLQAQLNTNFDELMLPKYGAALPADAQPDGRYFTKSGSGAGIYQVQSAAWVLVAS